MKGYRYEEDELPAGHVDCPKGDHLPELSMDKQKAEIAIRRGDKRGPKRANPVFVFEDLDVATALLTETRGKDLYEMSVHPSDIIHRADLCIYDEIVEALKRNEDPTLLVKEFWQGIERPSPRIELAVRQAVVTHKLIDN